MISSFNPPALTEGDTIGVIAPAGRLVDQDRFFSGVQVLQEMGYQVRYPRKLWPGIDHLADSDQRRGQECNEMFADQDIKAIVALRGGFGCLRMLNKINLTAVASHPKFLVGFSDVSLLQNYLAIHTGLISLHGPVMISLSTCEDSARHRLAQCLRGHWREPLPLAGVEVLRAADLVAAPLLGGNLASLVSIIGTPFDFSWKGKIIFLEDINEPAYRVDRMLTQLFLAGKFKNIAGLLLGDFSGLHPPGDQLQELYLNTICKRVLELCKDEHFPIWANLPIGHRANNQTLPLGAMAVLERDGAQLCFL
jgi:muramoyltetrapeptide carboxypeptidase